MAIIIIGRAILNSLKFLLMRKPKILLSTGAYAGTRNDLMPDSVEPAALIFIYLTFQ
jgi:hypothetical protein